ncbi:MAG: MOSC N-terminal beta barrel domain-containing protein [Acidimicrobiia bacterium]|nr:MOSC N-terminal beta barrel domain-containing protein [Acidimicrobiia bacterium]MBP8180296.1 MOSC N-terminal beta barrel domain-containing protein [Acidimicrobiia bacterium]
MTTSTGPRVAELWRYPIKSFRGERLGSVAVTPRGFEGDRLWMVVNSRGEMVTQRSTPVLATIEARWINGRVVLEYPGMEPLLLTPPADDAPAVETQVWRSSLTLRDGGDHAASWLSAVVGETLRVAFMPGDITRPVNPAFDPFGGQEVGLADGYPLLIVSLASLRALSDATNIDIPVDRFRANIVVDGCEPWDEDTWETLQIGSWEIAVTKPCERCSVPGVDQQTGRRVPGVIDALNSLRGTSGGPPLFGVNAVARPLVPGSAPKAFSTQLPGTANARVACGQKGNVRQDQIAVGDTMAVLTRAAPPSV